MRARTNGMKENTQNNICQLRQKTGYGEAEEKVSVKYPRSCREKKATEQMGRIVLDVEYRDKSTSDSS